MSAQRKSRQLSVRRTAFTVITLLIFTVCVSCGESKTTPRITSISEPITVHRLIGHRHMIIVNAMTGAVGETFPDTNNPGPDQAISDGKGGWYVAGVDAIGDKPYSGIAHIEPDGRADPRFKPRSSKKSDLGGGLVLHGSVLYVTQLGGTVLGLDSRTGRRIWTFSCGKKGGVVPAAYSNGILYVIGTINLPGVKRKGVAAIDLKTRRVTSFSVHFSGVGTGSGSPDEIYGLVVAGKTVFIGGGFTQVDGLYRPLGLVAVDARSGRPTSWNPPVRLPVGYWTPTGTKRDNPPPFELLLSHSQLLVGGNSGVGGFAVYDTKTGQRLSWRQQLDGDVSAFAASGDTVYLGDDETPGGFRVNGKPTHNLAAVLLPEGKFASWEPVLGNCSRVLALAVSRGKVLVTGDFKSGGCSSPF